MIDFLMDDNEFKLWIVNANADIGGGITTKEDIDRIQSYPDEENVMISGLNQQTFEYFVDMYGKQFKKIYFFKNKRIENLQPLSRLPNLEYLSFFFNQRVTEIWDMKNNISLATLILEDFSKLKNLRNIDTAPNLKNFYRGDAIWTKAETDSLAPLENSRIENLGFLFKKIENPSIQPLINMKALKRLLSHPGSFTTEECARFSVCRPDVQGWITKPYLDWGNGYILVVGKGKPLLKKPVDEKKLRKYEDHWNNLVNKYKAT